MQRNDSWIVELMQSGYSQSSVLCKKSADMRQLSRMLASAEQFNGRHFVSLANQFKVSTGAMAIRLEELELVSK